MRQGDEHLPNNPAYLRSVVTSSPNLAREWCRTLVARQLIQFVQTAMLAPLISELIQQGMQPDGSLRDNDTEPGS
ncbi:MAG: hypothetical protein H0U76_18600 [Ktedonobacteraceae bacterium]|nr:hypothetical protein [Ktedonobacteraceae bacterium]